MAWRRRRVDVVPFILPQASRMLNKKNTDDLLLQIIDEEIQARGRHPPPTIRIMSSRGLPIIVRWRWWSCTAGGAGMTSNHEQTHQQPSSRSPCQRPPPAAPPPPSCDDRRGRLLICSERSVGVHACPLLVFLLRSFGRRNNDVRKGYRPKYAYTPYIFVFVFTGRDA